MKKPIADGELSWDRRCEFKWSGMGYRDNKERER